MRYVVAVAEERNFTRAAERCFVVQSALSHQIKALERELGVTLFARTNRRVDVTAAGEAFLAAARISLEAAERAASDAAAATGEIRGTLTIGMIPTVTAVDMPAVLATFTALTPPCGSDFEGAVATSLPRRSTPARWMWQFLGCPIQSCRKEYRLGCWHENVSSPSCLPAIISPIENAYS